MPNPLDPQWQSYNDTQESLALIRRLSEVPGTRTATLHGTSFAAMADAAVDAAISVAKQELNAQTVLFLYATFESALRDDLSARSTALATAPGPHPAFGLDLATWFTDLVDDVRMDGVTRLYAPAAGPLLVAMIGNIRKYRHWLAHGRRGTAPPAVTPQFTYARLTQFLRACGLI